MSIINTLSEKLLAQTFEEEQHTAVTLSEYQQIAFTYSRIENSIAVLSDMKANKSYIYNGRVARELGFQENDTLQEINSIWEEDIFVKIHPDDLLKKHVMELQFFNIIKSLPTSERSDYHVKSKIRMRNKIGIYTPVEHRMFYVCSTINGSLWLALCLYNLSHDESGMDSSDGVILNAVTGQRIKPNQQEYNKILSNREKEILQLIRKGKMSKEVADLLSISINTVNRHRQNILEKLRVSNTHQACRIAEKMNLI